MKKITLVLCLSFVGFIGFSQQTKSLKDVNNLTEKSKTFTITLNNQTEVVVIDKILLNESDFDRSLKFNENKHELVHNQSKIKFNHELEQEAFTYDDGITYNDYTLNYSLKPILSSEETTTA